MKETKTFYKVDSSFYAGQPPIEREGYLDERGNLVVFVGRRKVELRKPLSLLVGWYFADKQDAIDWLAENAGRHKVLILKGEYGPQYWNVTTIDQLHRVALAILDRHYNDMRYFGYQELPTPPVELRAEQWAILNMNTTRELKHALSVYEALVESNKMLSREINKNNKFVELVERALTEQNGQLAYELLLERNDYEYEQIEVVELREVE